MEPQGFIEVEGVRLTADRCGNQGLAGVQGALRAGFSLCVVSALDPAVHLQHKDPIPSLKIESIMINSIKPFSFKEYIFHLKQLHEHT